ncbi:MAG: sensor domain-containing diguanylate cyclase [Spirochaetota bacterium]
MAADARMDRINDPDGRRHRAKIEKLISTPEIRHTLSELGIFVRNLRSGTGFANYVWYSLGYSDDEMSEDSWREKLHPDDRERSMRQYDELLAGKRAIYRETYRIRDVHGEWHWIMNSGRVVTWDDRGRPELFIGADVDITERRQAEAELERAKTEAEEQAQQAETLRTAGAIVASTLEVEQTVRLVLDQALNVVPYDTAMVALLRTDALEVIGGNGWEEIASIRGLRVPYPGENPHTKAIRSGAAMVIDDMVAEFPQFANISGSAIRSWLGVPLIVHGEVIGLMALDSASPHFFTPKHVKLASALGDHVAVALQNARLYEQTRELAMTDSLTGIATRRSFFVQAEQTHELAKRNERPISIIMADLDLFKEINDEYGHGTGDEAIRLAAGAAREVLRRSDIIGRYGGEEFSVVLPDTEQEQAQTIAERLRARVAEIVVPGTSRTLSISVGVATEYPGPNDTLDGVLDKADRALYVAKRRGRNRVEIYDQ